MYDLGTVGYVPYVTNGVTATENEMTIGELRALIANVPDDKLVQIELDEDFYGIVATRHGDDSALFVVTVE